MNSFNIVDKINSKINLQSTQTQTPDNSVDIPEFKKIFSILEHENAFPLSIRSPRDIVGTRAKRSDPIERVELSLHDGSLTVNGEQIKIPIGLCGPMTGKEFKKFAGIYQGDALFIHRNGGLQRIRDCENVEVIPDTSFTHRKEVPEIRSTRHYCDD